VAGATINVPSGGYRYIPFAFQYSGGVEALGGFRIERVEFADPLPLTEGFNWIERFLSEQSVPLTAFCACELRSPGQFSDAGFDEFNRHYAATLRRLGIMSDDNNPVARSNVVPDPRSQSEPSIHAFCFARPSPGGAPSFVIAGSGEAGDGPAPYRERTVRFGDTSPDAMCEKALFVLARLEQRMSMFDTGWADTTATQVYTVHDFHPFVADAILRRGAARHGLTWHLARPPVVGLEYEMDCRAVPLEHHIRV
jgi:hypothetical protein